MAYRIQYGKKKLKLRSVWRQMLYTVLFFLAFLYCALRDRAEVFWGVLPDAAQNMICQLQDGGDVADAVAAFCQEVFYD